MPTTLFLLPLLAALPGLPQEGLETPFDLRYAPRRWQASICLVDDPHKSIVGSDGALYYEYGRGPFFGFRCRVRPLLKAAAPLRRTAQELLDPRVPIVVTSYRAGDLALRVRAWAAAPRARGVERWAERRHDYLWLRLRNEGSAPQQAELAVEIDPARMLARDISGRRLVDAEDPQRVFCTAWPEPAQVALLASAGRLLARQSAGVERAWAQPALPSHARFRDVLVGWNAPLRYGFQAEEGHRYRAAFGLIEGYHERAGIRPLEIYIEGERARTVDLIAEVGRNHPLVLLFEVADRDGDGLIDLEVRSPAGARDHNTILSGLWVFERAAAVDAEGILSGALDERALAWVDASRPGAVPGIALRFGAGSLAPGEERQALLALHRGAQARPRIVDLKDAAAELERAERWWRAADLPYDRIQLPDAKLQGLLDACIRNIYQARELRAGRPAFQVGPTCYRGLWAADGPFLLEALTYLGRAAEVRPGLELLAEGDEGPQGVAFSKKAGLHLWMILRHAQLSGDRAWLEKMWPKVAAEVQRIRDYRAATRADPGAANFGLMPIGFGDGGLGGLHREYTNVYWNLAGLKAALAMAERLGKEAELGLWRAEYEDFWSCFDRARRRDQLVDEQGDRYVPVTMKGEEPQAPQRGAWAFLQAIFPGRIFAPSDELCAGTMAMLGRHEREGVLHGTGWLPDGIWNYAASFYAHALLWRGEGARAAAVLYAFADHACPLLCWREEQNLAGAPERYVGDMPHNWASAEFIRLVRHLLILERGEELHLLEGLPRRWIAPGATTRMSGIATSFGEVSLVLAVAPDGRSAVLEVSPPTREPCRAVVVHLERFGEALGEVRVEGRLVADRPVRVAGVKPFRAQLHLERR